jgi:S-DNA-T family DNA segregation ATPase FtsK/SpoIIIE
MWLRTSSREAAESWPHGGPAGRRLLGLGLLAACVVYAAGSLAAAVPLPVLPVIIFCAILGAAFILAALLSARTLPTAAYASACGIVAAGWLAYAGTSAPWAWPTAVALAAAVAVLAALYPTARARAEHAAEEARRAAEAAAIAQAERKWPDLLGRIGHSGVRFAGREDTGTGYKVHLRLPGSGRVTYSALAPATEQLEVAARLRHGSLRFERGDQAHKVILHVTERDVLADIVPFPADRDPLSIGGPVPLGLFEDGQVCAVTLREVATLIVGLRGSGKSNLLNVLLAQLARCPDVLIFAIDLKGGRMAAPWVEPWLAGRSPRPVVDWLATDREEAERMLRALIRAVEARSRSGSGGEKITPSPQQPAILLVCDEIAVILGIGTGGPRNPLEGVTNATLASLANQLVMTGRSEAIDLIMATQRGTVTMTGSADLKSQCAVRIGLGVASEADARLIIPDDIRIAADLARLRHPGTGIVQQGKYGRVLPVKFYRIEHEAISEIAEQCGQFRPEPDPLLAEALGPDYATRWSPGRAGGMGVVRRAVGQPAVAAIEDAGHPGRGRMVALLKSAGVRGMTVRGIADQLAADGREVAHQTIHRWLTEEAAAGRVEGASYGRWKWLGGQ